MDDTHDKVLSPGGGSRIKFRDLHKHVDESGTLPLKDNDDEKKLKWLLSARMDAEE